MVIESRELAKENVKLHFHAEKLQLDDESIVLLKFSKGAKSRRRILQLLQLSPRNCNQIAKSLKSDWWTVQKHLKRLERAGIVRSISFGRIQFYKTTAKGDLVSNHAFQQSLRK